MNNRRLSIPNKIRSAEHNLNPLVPSETQPEKKFIKLGRVVTEQKNNFNPGQIKSTAGLSCLYRLIQEKIAPAKVTHCEIAPFKKVARKFPIKNLDFHVKNPSTDIPPIETKQNSR